MKRYIAYLKYILRHKYFVFVASRRVGCSLWRALVHDLSKFSPMEWGAYARTFYNADGTKRYNENRAFNYAWNHHQKYNKHHWQYWVLMMDSGSVEPLAMPDTYVREMVADWAGAGKAITGEWGVLDWYDKNKDNMVMNKYTRVLVNKYLLEFVIVN